MTAHPDPSAKHEPKLYEIRIRGRLDNRWADRFEGLNLIDTSDGNTMLRGILADQAALYGILKRIRDLGLELISVHLIFDE